MEVKDPMKEKVTLNPNPLVKYLQKPAEEFTREDIIRYVVDHEIRMINFRYVGGDGRLKTLNFVINSLEHLYQILTFGERVDGSSLFTYINTTDSDLYVIPRFRTAFVDPFSSIPTLDILCSFFNSKGEPFEAAPEQLVHRAHVALQKATGYSMEVLGELEYYLFSEVDHIYPIVEQKGYHESHPFSKWASVRREAMDVLCAIGAKIKYGHAEVGNIIRGDLEMVQGEIEFLPVSVEDAADQLALGKWVLREIAYKYNLEVSFAPKIIVGHAGSGLHIHARLMKDGHNVMRDSQGLSVEAKKLIAGFLDLAPALTAFGNTVPTSFLRLVPHQEAPTSICWGERNRSALVRVPLGWAGTSDMLQKANPLEKSSMGENNNQTVEIRSPDGSANVHQLIAGLTVAARHGLTMPDALGIAEKLHIVQEASRRSDLEQLPASCAEAADALEKQRALFEAEGVFPPMMLDKLTQELRAHEDRDMSEKLFGNADALKDLVTRYIHVG